jgi:DNA-binding transcriptional MerR regulator
VTVATGGPVITVTTREARARGYRRAGEVAELLGVTVRTVHYYEEEGLVTPLRTPSGTRFYTDFHLRRLDACVRLACVGVPLRTVRSIAESRHVETGDQFGKALAEVLAAMRSDLRANLETLRHLLADLERAERIARNCWSCPNRPTRLTCPDCPCEAGLGSSLLMQLAWDPDRPSDDG